MKPFFYIAGSVLTASAGAAGAEHVLDSVAMQVSGIEIYGCMIGALIAASRTFRKLFDASTEQTRAGIAVNAAITVVVGFSIGFMLGDWVHLIWVTPRFPLFPSAMTFTLIAAFAEYFFSLAYERLPMLTDGLFARLKRVLGGGK